MPARYLLAGVDSPHCSQVQYTIFSHVRESYLSLFPDFRAENVTQPRTCVAYAYVSTFFPISAIVGSASRKKVGAS